MSSPDNNLKVIVMDKDNVSDDMVGEGQVNLTKFRGNSTEQECIVFCDVEIVQLYYQGKAAGKVLLRISGGGGQGGNNFNQGQGNNWGNAQQNNGWGGNQQPNNQWGGNQQQPNNQWGGNQPQPNQWGGNQQQPNNQWGGNQNGSWGQGNQNNGGWGNTNAGWNQQPGQIANQGGNQWGGQGGMNNPNPNQPPANFNQFTPIVQNIAQWGNQQPNVVPPNPQNNQWGNQPPNNQWGGQPNSQWGSNPQQPVNPNAPKWGNQPNPNVPVKPNNEISYPDLEYKPPNTVNPNPQGPYPGGNNPNPYGTAPNNPNLDVPFQLIGGMQGLFTKPNNNSGGNPYAV